MILPRVDMIKWYPILLGAIVFFQALGLWAFWRILLGEKVLRRHLLVLNAVSLAVFWANLPPLARRITGSRAELKIN